MQSKDEDSPVIVWQKTSSPKKQNSRLRFRTRNIQRLENESLGTTDQRGQWSWASRREINLINLIGF